MTRYLFFLTSGLLAVVVLVLGALWFTHHQYVVERDLEARAGTMAHSVAAMSEVKRALLEDEDPSVALAPMAETLRETSGFEYIVVADRNGIRQSHPVPAAIGQSAAADPTSVLAGESWVGVDRGPAGMTLRARVPIFEDAGGAVTGTIGYVSVGILTSDVVNQSRTAVPLILVTMLMVLVAGGIGAYVISRRIRSRTRGLEPDQIAELLDSREALLFAIGEGVLALDRAGNVVLVNSSARQLLSIGDGELGRHFTQVGLDPQLCALLETGESATDAVLAVEDRILVCSYRRVRVDDADGGAVLTFRDQTELTELSGELDGARTVTRGLRAQRHEFANRIHTVAGMLELGAIDRARAYLNELSTATIRANTEVTERIADITLSALILVKSVQAAEQGTNFEVSPLSWLPGEFEGRLGDDVLLVAGNLVDNALEAVGEDDWVELLVQQHDDVAGAGTTLVEIRVTDSGPGIDESRIGHIFDAGVTTKDLPGSDRRGLGLALVRQACRRWGGSVSVESTEETVFTAYLPTSAPGAHRHRAVRAAS